MSGIIIGILFGFTLKRSSFSVTNELIDVYYKNKRVGIYNVFLIIFLQSIIYFTLVNLNLIEILSFSDFSVVSTAFGGYIFGIGAMFSEGSITTSLLKVGDAHLDGIVSAASFSIFAISANQGLISNHVDFLQSITIVSDDLLSRLPFSIFLIIIPALIITVYLIIDYYKIHNIPKDNTKSNGIMEFLFKRVGNQTYASIVIAIIAGLAFYFSYKSGRNGGLGITNPLISVTNYFINNTNLLDWGNFFILGIVLGSLIYKIGSLNFSIKDINKESMLKSILGGALMGLGAVFAQGSIVGNGLVGTATFSLKSWIALFFIIIGLWSGTYIFHIRPNLIDPKNI